MKFYHEITVLPNYEIGENFIWSRLFTQIHLALVAIKEIENGKDQVSIGVSFPQYIIEKKPNIGSKLRLFAQNESELQKLDIQKWLSRLNDYIHISGIREVPAKIDSYAIYSRQQPKVNKERLARRYAKRHDIDYELALKHYEDMKEKRVNLPFIKLKSLSGGDDFCLWIKKHKIDQPNFQKFSTYGLSNFDKEKISDKNYSTVPEF